MSAPKNLTFEWDLKSVAPLIDSDEKTLINLFMDGRRISNFMERSIQKRLKGWKLAPSESSPYDLVDDEGQKWEVRSITRRGVYFNPSNQVGSGRKFNEAEFLKKLDQLKGYCLADVCILPKFDVRFVEAKTIRKWYEEGRLGKNTRVSRKKILQMLQEIV